MLVGVEANTLHSAVTGIFLQGIISRSAVCGLDPSHSDSGCSPFEKLNSREGGGWRWWRWKRLELAAARELAELNEGLGMKREEKKKIIK